MKKGIPQTVVLIPVIAMCSCASVTIRGPAHVVQGKDGTQRLASEVAYKASGIDRLPMQDVEIPGGISIHEHMPGNVWPTQRITTTNRDGSVTVNENPLYASNASNTTNAIHNLWSGVVKSVAASGFAAWSVLGLGAQATSAQIATTNANAKTANINAIAGARSANIATKAAASTEKLGIIAPLSVRKINAIAPIIGR